MSNPNARPAANLPMVNPSPHQLATGGTLTPIPSNASEIFAETQASYLASTPAASRPAKTRGTSNQGVTE